MCLLFFYLFSSLCFEDVQGANYVWSTGNLTQTINVNAAGIYWVIISNNCGILTDSIVLAQYSTPVVSFGNDTLYCSAFNRLLNATNAGASYLWSTGSNFSTLSVNAAGTYWVNVSNNCGNAIDTITITQSSLPVSLLGTDTLYGTNFSRILNGGINATSYLWNDATTNQSITVNQAGTFWVQLNNSCGTVSDTIHIVQAAPPQVNLGSDTSFCGNFSISFDASCIACNYLWSNNAVTPQVSISIPGMVIVNVSNLCGVINDSVLIISEPIPYVLLPVDTMLCEPAGYYILAYTNASKILWSTGDTSLLINIPSAGVYWVDVNNQYGVDVDTITISECPGEYIMPNAFSPNADGRNDFLFPIRIGNADLVQYDIYNRWGQLVFTYADGDINWDGTYYDMPCSIGVYIYIVRYRDNVTGSVFMLKGNATLVR